nr:hypothetical protein [Tanacetum cinerariifolium]
PTFRGSNTRSGGLWSGGLDSKRGANCDQHSRDQRARSGGLWSGGLDPKRGANHDQHSRDQRGRWFFKGWGIVMIPHQPEHGIDPIPNTNLAPRKKIEAFRSKEMNFTQDDAPNRLSRIRMKLQPRSG